MASDDKTTRDRIERKGLARWDKGSDRDATDIGDRFDRRGGGDFVAPLPRPNVGARDADGLGEIASGEGRVEARLHQQPSDPRSLAGGSPEENAAQIRVILSGEERGPKRDAILLNAAGGIAAAGHADDLREGLEVARRTLDAGDAATRLDELVAFSRAAA